jgi:hypothetical protein
VGESAGDELERADLGAQEGLAFLPCQWSYQAVKEDTAKVIHY